MPHFRHLAFAIGLLLSTNLLAYSGPGAGGGGVVFNCTGGVYLADSYGLFSGASAEYYHQVRKISEKQALEGILRSLKNTDPQLDREIRKNLSDLEFKEQYEYLPLLGDDDIAEVPAGCQKIQMAIQNLSTGVVKYNHHYFSTLNSVERALFKLHEAYVRYFRRNSIQVRSRVSQESWSEVYQKILAQAARPPEHGVCAVVQYLPFVNLACALLDTTASDIQAEQVAVYNCENNPNAEALSSSFLDICHSIFKFLSLGHKPVGTYRDHEILRDRMADLHAEPFLLLNFLQQEMTKKNYRFAPNQCHYDFLNPKFMQDDQTLVYEYITDWNFCFLRPK